MEDQEQTLDIKRYVRIVHKRRYHAVLVAAGIIAVITAYSYMKPPVFEASTTVSIEKNYLNVLINDITVAPSIDDRVRALSIMMTSRRMLLRVLTELGIPMATLSEEQTTKFVRYYQKSTQIKFDQGRSGRDMDLFTVTYRDVNPQFARDYVNTLVKDYIDDSLSMHRKEAQGANRFIYEQLELYKDKIERTEAELSQLRKKPGVQAVSQLAVLKKKYEELLVQYTDNHPEVLKVKAEMQALQEQEREQGKSAQVNKDTNKNRDEERTASAGATKRNIAELERNRDSYKRIYESLAASLGRSEVSAQVEEQAKANMFNIVEPAVLPVLPAGSPRWKMIAAGLFVGIAGGVGVAVLLDMMDRTIKDIGSLKAIGLPVIVAIPRIRNAVSLAAMKRKDRLLYGAAGVYVAGVVTLAVIEFLK